MPRVIDGVGWQNRNQKACKRYKGHYKLRGMRFKSNCVPLSVDLSKQMMADVRKVFSRYCKKVDGYYVSPGVAVLN